MIFFSYLLLISSLLNLLVVFYSFLVHKNKSSKFLSLLLISNIFYSIGYAFELRADTIEDVLFWLRIQYIGIAYVPYLIIAFAFEFTGRSFLLNKYITTILLTICTATLVIHYTNQFTGWFYSDYKLNHFSNFYLIETQKGIWYWIHQVYSIIAMIIFDAFFIKQALNSQHLIRRQSIIMLLSSLIVWVFYLLYITGNTPDGVDSIPFAYSIVGFIWTWAIYRYKLGDLVPLALESVFDSMGEGVIICDKQNRITHINHVSQKFFPGLNLSSSGNSIFEVFKDFPDFLSMAKGINFKGYFDFDFKVNDKHFYCQVTINPIKTSNGVEVGNTFIIHDLTKRKETELKLHENESKLKELLATRDKFFSIIGHDLRGPIGNIASYSNLIISDLKSLDEANIKNALKLISSSAMNSLELLENIMLWSQSQKGTMKFEPEPTDIQLLVEHVLALLNPVAISKKITIHNLLPKGMFVVVDKNMISSVFRNLINNSIKFSFIGGIVKIEGKIDQKAFIISITDQGMGISPQMIKKIFHLGKVRSTLGTSNETGSGFGLVLCKEFITKHNGKIWVESNEGKGSTFYLQLPKESVDIQ